MSDCSLDVASSFLTEADTVTSIPCPLMVQRCPFLNSDAAWTISFYWHKYILNILYLIIIFDDFVMILYSIKQYYGWISTLRFRLQKHYINLFIRTDDKIFKILIDLFKILINITSHLQHNPSIDSSRFRRKRGWKTFNNTGWSLGKDISIGMQLWWDKLYCSVWWWVLINDIMIALHIHTYNLRSYSKFKIIHSLHSLFTNTFLPCF